MWESENQDESPLMTTDNFHGIDRLAFRQMAKALAGLAFSEQFGPTERSTDFEDPDDATLSEHTPPSPSFEMPLADHEEEDLERDVDAEVDAEHRAPT